mgnify:CR=1 FL=1
MLVSVSSRERSGWQRDLSASYDNVASVQIAQGDLAVVLKFCRDSLAISHQRAAGVIRSQQRRLNYGITVRLIALSRLRPSRRSEDRKAKGIGARIPRIGEIACYALFPFFAFPQRQMKKRLSAMIGQAGRVIEDAHEQLEDMGTPCRIVRKHEHVGPFVEEIGFAALPAAYFAEIDFEKIFGSRQRTLEIKAPLTPVAERSPTQPVLRGKFPAIPCSREKFPC